MILGWSEWVQLPSLNLHALRVKVDTGAKTSSLHAENVSVRNGEVFFTTSPIPEHSSFEIECSAAIIDERKITNSDGASEMRYVIQADLVLGSFQRQIEVTLNDRSRMRYRMLLGRQAFASGMTVNPLERYMLPKLSYAAYGYSGRAANPTD